MSNLSCGDRPTDRSVVYGCFSFYSSDFNIWEEFLCLSARRFLPVNEERYEVRLCTAETLIMSLSRCEAARTFSYTHLCNNLFQLLWHFQDVIVDVIYFFLATVLSKDNHSNFTKFHLHTIKESIIVKHNFNNIQWKYVRHRKDVVFFCHTTKYI